MKFVAIGLGYVMYKLLLTITTIVSCLTFPFHTIGQLKSDLNAIGIVVDDSQKQPLSEALVVLINSTLAIQDTVETGDDGNFVFQLERGQKYRLFASNGKVSSEITHFETKDHDRDRVFSFFFSLPSPNSPNKAKVIYKSPNAKIADDNMSKIIKSSRTQAPLDLGSVYKQPYISSTYNKETSIQSYRPPSTLEVDTDRLALPNTPTPATDVTSVSTIHKSTAQLSINKSVSPSHPKTANNPTVYPPSTPTASWTQNGKSGTVISPLPEADTDKKELVVGISSDSYQKTPVISHSTSLPVEPPSPQKEIPLPNKEIITTNKTATSEKEISKEEIVDPEKVESKKEEIIAEKEISKEEIVDPEKVESKKEEIISEKETLKEEIVDPEEEKKDDDTKQIKQDSTTTATPTPIPFFLKSDVIVFRVVVGEFSHALPLECDFLREIKNELTIETSPEGNFQYFAGGPFNDYNLAEYYRLRTVAKGYINAQIKAYRNNQWLNLPLQEIIKLKQKEKAHLNPSKKK